MTTPTAARDLNHTLEQDRTRATGVDLRAALQAAAAWLSVNAERINALNVFPVPDGDTGTNMSMTLRAAVDGLGQLADDAPVSLVARSTYEAAMLGARGNSGVILSQLLRGFSQALAGETELTPAMLAAALSTASDVAYQGVSHPVEGTILTVARVAAAAAMRIAAQPSATLPDVLEETHRAASAAVDATPAQLDVLRKAGVVDSGGEGYRVILEGAWMGSTGRTQELSQPGDAPPYGRALLHASDVESTFGFCTEFLLRDADVSVAAVKARMEALGESVIVVGDAALLRVHVHTLRPGQALDWAVDHGTLDRVKVENMQLQHASFAAAGEGRSAERTELQQQASSIGVIAVAAGEGFLNVFKSLGARVVPGGQTMNPSVQEILAAVNSSGYRELIILPNNSNIVLTAQQVQTLTPHHVSVVPTETAPQGISALLAFNFQADGQTNVDAMQQAAHAVHTVEVTRAVRDADVDGQQVRAGEMLGMYDGQLVGTSTRADRALVLALEHASVEALEIVTIYYGAGATRGEADAVAAEIRGAHPGLAVETVEGGQPHYPYVASLE